MLPVDNILSRIDPGAMLVEFQTRKSYFDRFIKPPKANLFKRIWHWKNIREIKKRSIDKKKNGITSQRLITFRRYTKLDG